MSAKYMPESRFLTINGLRLHHLDWGNPGAPPLVFVHGLRGSAHAFDGPARRLRERFHIIATDVRGRGDSEWSPIGAYDRTDYVSDLEGIVDALGLAHFTLVGTSMGGRIGMNYAAHHADRLEALVLNDIGVEGESGSERITQEAANAPASFPTLEAVMAYRRKTNPGMASLSEEEMRERTLFLFKELPDGQFAPKMDPAILRKRATEGVPPPQPELWPVLASFRRPTLVIWGTASDVLSEAQARRMIETLPMGELAPVPGVGHAPTLSEPSAAEALDRFLDKVLHAKVAV